MRAVLLTSDHQVQPAEIAAPGEPGRRHVIVRMTGCAINPGDKFFIPYGSPGVWGASGAGIVTAVGADVGRDLLGRAVAVYRSLRVEPGVVGTMCEQAEVHHLSCLPLPDGSDPMRYSGSLVNAITAYSFWRRALTDGCPGVLVTAPNSASGRAMLGLAQARDVPFAVIARDADAAGRLDHVSADRIVVAGDADFAERLTAAVRRFELRSVFDGVGGSLIDRLLPQLAPGTIISQYGALAGERTMTLSTDVMRMRAIALRGFANVQTETVLDDGRLRSALDDLSGLIARPEFMTPPGPTFATNDIAQALETANAIVVPIM